MPLDYEVTLIFLFASYLLQELELCNSLFKNNKLAIYYFMALNETL